MRWLKDPLVESNLRELGIKFEVAVGIPSADIDRAEGLRRQVRLTGKLMDDVVLRYAMRMEEPAAVFKMPILQWEKKRKSYFPWSGNHRLGSFDLADLPLPKVVDAYVVEVFDPVMQDLLPRLVNTWEAVVGMSKEEAIINARFMVEKHGMPVEVAAQKFGLKKEAIYRDQRAEETRVKASALGASVNGFTKTILTRLHTISGNANVLKKTCKLLHDYKVKGKEAEAVVDDVRAGETEAQQIVQLEKWERSLEDRNKPKKREQRLPYKEANRERFFRLLTSLARFVEVNKSITQAQISDPAHLQVARQQWRTIQSGMELLLGERSAS